MSSGEPLHPRLCRATARDATAIAEVFDAAVGPSSASERAQRPMFSPEHWDQLVADHVSPDALLVATDGADRVIGFTAIHAEAGEVFLVFVDPAHAGRGVARVLLRAAHDVLIATGHREAFLFTEERNVRAREVYAAAGYRPDGGVRESDFEGAALREVRLVKDLNSMHAGCPRLTPKKAARDSRAARDRWLGTAQAHGGPPPASQPGRLQPPECCRPSWHGGPMSSMSLHISARIDRPVGEVYEYASDPVNLPTWAPGLGTSVEQVNGQWIAESPMGRVAFAFVSRNEYGVLDHDVTLPSGETVHNPMRVIADGPGCEVVFTLRQQPGMSDEDFARDANAVSADLATLKRILEGRQPIL